MKISERSINSMDWPSKSVDLCRIKTMWAVVARLFHLDRRELETAVVLRTRIIEGMRNVESKFVLMGCTVRSCSRTKWCTAVLQCKGMKVDY